MFREMLEHTMREYYTDYETEHWIKATLTNDEASTDEELVQHFMKVGGLSEQEARAWVAKRGEYLRGELK